ncbi:DUF3023 domain-containing protein [Ehrlichia ruminantium]|uniref:DUF3023 domain-containing protein n=1 Tax=Ehrlichia ruminantium TaxID=779 RepID=UPI0015DC50C9|nr:DUF3023 domain-containing protein [Ehrlichia ruminantium]QLK53394.1 DUF3023 domain-containing protein [Ehrlichia ruminantium]
MLFKPGSPVAKITESLHKSVIYELNRVPEIHLNTCHCIGATTGKKLDIWINNNPSHRCTPAGTSLFRMECIIPSSVINNPRNISLQKLIQVLSSRFSRTQPLKADVYFIVPEEEFKNFRSTVSPLCSMGLNELLPVYNIGKFGAFCVCRPKSIGNKDVSGDVLFDEYKALKLLGGLEDSNFFKTPLPISNTTKRNRKQKIVVTGKIQNKIQLISKMFSRTSTTQCSPLSTPGIKHNIEEKTASSTQKPNIQKVIVTSNQPSREKIKFICTKFPEASEYPSLNQRQETGSKYLEQRLSKSTADSTPFTQKDITYPQQVVRQKTQFASSPFYFYQEQPLLTTKHSSSNQRQETRSKYLEQRLSKSTADSTPFTQKGTTDSQQVVRPKTQFASSPFYFYQEQPLLTTKHSSSNQRQETTNKHLEQRTSNKSIAPYSMQLIQKGTVDPQQVVRPKTQSASSRFYKEQGLPTTKHPSSNQRQEATNKHLEQRPSTKSTVGSKQLIQKGTVDPQQVVRPKTQSASSRFYKEQGLSTTKHKVLSAIKESTDSTSVNTLSSEEDLRFLNVDYSSSCEILYDTFRESYKVSALPTSPLIPSHQLEDDVFVEDGHQHVSYL